MEPLLTSLQAWLDPENLGPLLVAWAGRIIAAVIIFLIGRWIISLLVGWLHRGAARANMDATLARFLGNLLRITLLLFVVLTALNVIGVPTTNFLAVIGAAGLAVGLALKDSLANFSSGVMLVVFRPFKVGDFIEASGIAGSASEIGMFSTVIKTGDNRVITVPNSLIYGDTITNFSAEPNRRIDMTIGIAYDDDIPKAKSLISEILEADERVLAEPAPAILLLELGSSSIDIAVRPWVRREDYWTARSDLLERIKTTLEKNGMSIPFPQHDVHLFSEAANNA
jgi:small conductance mechanosensitive channel